MKPLTLTAPAAAATVLAVARWAQQGTGNLYSDLNHRVYVPDPVAGYRLLDEGPVWLGAEIIAVLAGLTVAIFIAARWLSKRGASPMAQYAILAVSVATLVAPIVAFASGGLPADAVETRPTTAIDAPTAGIQASLDGLDAGRYRVRGDHPATSVVATVSAGGESFETRFGGISGEFNGDPGDFLAPLSIAITLDATTVDTGVDLRSKSAREYLEVDAHPTISLAIESFSATERSAPATVSFAAQGRLALAGDTIPVEVTGTLQTLDDASRSQRQIDSTNAMLVTANFEVPIKQTVLAADASDFSADVIPIAVSLLLTNP